MIATIRLRMVFGGISRSAWSIGYIRAATITNGPRPTRVIGAAMLATICLRKYLVALISPVGHVELMRNRSWLVVEQALAGQPTNDGLVVHVVPFDLAPSIVFNIE